MALQQSTPGPVLAIQESHCRDIDPQNPDHLCRLWSVFSKASAALENGERLQNMTWRLWNRETLRRSPPQSPQSSFSNPQPITSPTSSFQMPELSRSVDSCSSQEDDHVLRTPKERHFTPLDLQHLLHSISEKQELRPLSPATKQPDPPQPALPQDIPHANPTTIAAGSSLPSPQRTATQSSASTVATATDSFNSAGGSSDTSVSSEESAHSIVRGFTPGCGTTSYTSKSPLVPAAAAVQPTPIVPDAKPHVPKQRKSGMFQLGSSSDEESFREHVSLKSTNGATPRQECNQSSKKQTSFQDEVLIMRERRQRRSSAVFESDSETASEGEDASESAIDDDDDAWEDEDNGEHHKEDEKEISFQRVDSSANITSRRSMLTMNLTGQTSSRDPQSLSALSRAQAGMRRSRTSTPNGPSIPASPTEEDSIMERRASQMQKSRPLIPTTTNLQGPPMSTSPKTTKRNMLTGELSESLRMNMLSERKQKNPLGLMQQQMKRAHTASDVSKLSQLSEVSNEAGHSVDGKSNANNTRRPLHPNYYFDHSVGEYHQAGW